jgi:hypothetical protein
MTFEERFAKSDIPVGFKPMAQSGWNWALIEIAAERELVAKAGLEARIQCLKECSCRECLGVLPLAIAELNALLRPHETGAEDEDKG